MIGYDRYRGHRYVGLHVVDRARHFGGAPDPPDQVVAAPKKSDKEIEEEARQARLQRQRARGRRATVLTGNTPSSPTYTGGGSAGSPGSAQTIG